MLRTILPLSFVSAFLMAFVTATPKDSGVGRLWQEIVAIVSPTPGTLVATMDGALYDEIADRDRQGCLVMISGAWSALREAQNPIDRLSDTLAARGWTPRPYYSADGTDGTLYGMEKDGFLCLMQGRWDGGDDSDSTYVPLDIYQMTILCTRLDTQDASAGPK